MFIQTSGFSSKGLFMQEFACENPAEKKSAQACDPDELIILQQTTFNQNAKISFIHAHITGWFCGWP